MSSDKKVPIRGKVIISRLFTENNKAIAQKYRKLNGYPKEGFFNPAAYEAWVKKHPRSKKNFFPSFLHEFTQSNQDLTDEIANGEFYLVFKDLFLYTRVQHETIVGMNDTGCQWHLVTKEDIQDNKKMKEGVYIKISTDSNISNIKKFLDRQNQSDTFEYFASLVKHKKGQSPDKNHFRFSSLEESNMEILRHRKLSAEDLSVLSGLNKKVKKDEHIAAIMTKKGRKMKAGTVRAIFSQYKNKKMVHEL